MLDIIIIMMACDFSHFSALWEPRTTLATMGLVYIGCAAENCALLRV